MTPPNTSKVPVGTIVGDKFRITQEIGRGGMAAVYEAENIQIGKRVAVKILAAELVKSKVVTGRFIREARAMAAIKSPYICEVYDSGEFDDRPFMVLELLEGESLYDLLSRLRRLDGELTHKIAGQCAQGLTKAHEINVVHRDLKPENIFLTRNEEGGITAKLLDFGLAKFYDNSTDADQIRLTREGALFGTPAYMSPEQAKGIDEVDHRTDLWALGCIVYECLTGKTVWNADQGVAMILAQIAGAPVPRPTRLRPDLPTTFDDWFQRALDRDPNKRFQDAKTFADSLGIALKPPEGSIKTVPLASIEEGAVVDDLVHHSKANIGGRIEPIDLRADLIQQMASSSDDAESVPSQPRPSSQDPASEAKVIDSLPPPQARSGTGRAIAALLVFAMLAVGGYAGWLYVAHPPSVGELKAVAKPLEVVDSDEAVERTPLETEPFGLQIGSAQARLVEGERAAALTMFKEAFNAGGHRAAQSLLHQAAVSLAKQDGPCEVTGLGRPRPFDVFVPSSRPSLTLTATGPLVAWADNHEEPGKRRGYAALLDNALRRVTPAHNITPEATSVRHTQLVATDKRVALIYWDASEKSPGVFSRLLRRDGRIAGPARRISEPKRQQFFPTLALAEDGTFWAVWEEELTPEVEDLFARHLNSELEPISDIIRVTSFRQTKTIDTAAHTPDAVIVHDHLKITYAFQRDTDYEIQLVQIPLDDPQLEKGLEPPKDDKEKKLDRTLGTKTTIGPARGKNKQPRMACTDEGCFVVWDDELSGAFAAFVEKGKNEALWHREFAAKAARPAIGVSPTGTVAAAWYENRRARIATLDRDGVGDSSFVGRVSGYQPYSSMVAGNEPGEWYISWRDYESGAYEAFIVRVKCQ